MELSVLLITRTIPVRDSIEQVMRRIHVQVRHYMSTANIPAEDSASVVLCTTEIDWRGLLRSLREHQEVARPVILLMPAANPKLWADALLAGAFDAVAMTEAGACLQQAVGKAHSRWLRARSVREALNKISVRLHTADGNGQ